MYFLSERGSLDPMYMYPSSKVGKNDDVIGGYGAVVSDAILFWTGMAWIQTQWKYKGAASYNSVSGM